MEDQTHNDDTIVVPRSAIFVLLDGSFVVRWDSNQVQELETGQYRTFNRRDFGANITDYELNQLKQSGLVEHYDREAVWLCLTPSNRVVSAAPAWEQNRHRSYYLHTTLPGRLLQDVIDLLERLEVGDSFEARLRDDFVVIWGSKGLAFQKFDDAEKARLMLTTEAPEAFETMVVAFVETPRRA
jgi:hypothetical protein